VSSVRADPGELAQRASFALRNHLSGLLALTHVLEGTPDALAALRETVVRVALDADLLTDLALASSDDPQHAAPLDQLLQESVRPLRWLAEVVGAPISVLCPESVDAGFLRPHEAVATGRRLVAGLIAEGPPTGIVLEARAEADGVLVAARRAGTELDRSRLAAPAPSANANEMQLDVLEWVLGRRDLRRQLLSEPGAVLAIWVAPA
jgi:hypothetical protein